MKKMGLFLLFVTTSLHTCHRRPFHHEDYKIKAANDFIAKRYRKHADNLSLFELLEAVTDALMLFFDTANNHESFNTHVQRLHDFHPLINAKLADEEGLKKDFQNYAAEYQTEFGEFMSYKEFKKNILELNKHYNTFCKKMIDQTYKRSSWQICKIFYEFKNKFNPRFFVRMSRISGIEISSYKIWSIVRYRLSIKN